MGGIAPLLEAPEVPRTALAIPCGQVEGTRVVRPTHAAATAAARGLVQSPESPCAAARPDASLDPAGGGDVAAVGCRVLPWTVSAVYWNPVQNEGCNEGNEPLVKP